MKKYLFIFTLINVLSACEGSSNSAKQITEPLESTEPPVYSTDNIAIPKNTDKTAYNILIIGNSHVSGIEQQLRAIFATAVSDKIVEIHTRGGQFLDTIVDDENIIELIENKEWTHIILQGQKYSQSQSVLYPIDSTVTWIKRAKAIGATPVLFPEHPQVGRPNEAEYIHGIHLNIAKEQASCVAPVGLAWNQALLISPDLNVYKPDGNHASELGTLLTSLVLYEVISGEPADLLPYIEHLPADATTLALFGQVSSQAIADNLPCNY